MEFLNQNNLILGLAIGLLFPLFGFSVVYGVFDIMMSSGFMDDAPMHMASKRMRTITLMGICSNIYWIRRYNKRLTNQTLRGVIIATMILCITWFVYYYPSLYDA